MLHLFYTTMERLLSYAVHLPDMVMRASPAAAPWWPGCWLLGCWLPGLAAVPRFSPSCTSEFVWPTTLVAEELHVAVLAGTLLNVAAAPAAVCSRAQPAGRVALVRILVAKDVLGRRRLAASKHSGAVTMPRLPQLPVLRRS